jgi:hypothetical protein
MSGQCDFPGNHISYQPSSHFCSNLSGPFFLFSPLSTVGILVARMIRQIPYLHMGSTWALGGKHEGAGTRQTMQEKLTETHSQTDFVTAGQDALALVAFLAHFMGECKLNAVNFEDYSISCAKVHHTCCRRCRYQGTSSLHLSGGMPSTLARRRSQPIAPGFPSPCIDISY